MASLMVNEVDGEMEIEKKLFEKEFNPYVNVQM